MGRTLVDFAKEADSGEASRRKVVRIEIQSWGKWGSVRIWIAGDGRVEEKDACLELVLGMARGAERRGEDYAWCFLCRWPWWARRRGFL